MSKVISIIVGCVATALGVLLFLSYSTSAKRIADLESQLTERDSRIASLSASWEELGEASTAVVLNRNVTSGEEINEITAPELLQIVTVPKKLNLNLLAASDFPDYQLNAPISSVSDPFGETDFAAEGVTESAEPQADIVKTGLPGAKFIRASLSEGSVIAKDYLLERQLKPTERKYDMLVDEMPIGTLPGNFVDIRIKFPFGQDYIALSHKRIDELNGGVAKLNLTEYEIEVYNSLLVDKIIYDATIYMLEYVDSGAQGEAKLNYPLNPNVGLFMAQNPSAINDIREVIALERELVDATAVGAPEDLQQRQQYYDQLKGKLASQSGTRGNTLHQQQMQFLQRMDMAEMGGAAGGNFDLGETRAPGSR